ncbi:hypothetical protein SADUNF_Sadunf11G0088100 [Salix dunnii]|uniref:Uncharacterized protein n=1 Tax=Salix dunnii TaxID=1413687 RepID=A0A835MTH0_9ROSI|nr:hypothetical protein SADUNF_Sadunf11G0088100 [Salix dunnii]
MVCFCFLVDQTRKIRRFKPVAGSCSRFRFFLLENKNRSTNASSGKQQLVYQVAEQERWKQQFHSTKLKPIAWMDVFSLAFHLLYRLSSKENAVALTIALTIWT